MSHSKRFQFSGFERSRDRYDLPNRDTIRKCTTRLLVVGVSLLVTGVLPVEALQDRFRIVNQAQAQVRAQVVRRLVETRQEVELDELNSGAVLKTDPDLEGTLEKAERFRVDGNFRVACQLWQAVLNQSGDALYSEDGVTYLSLVDQVETILANLPPEGLAAYRVLADASAKEILASAETDSDESALNQVVRQYFVSTLGDQAAFDLGCIYLDRFDFSGARRMFEKIIRKYPDPKIPVEKIYVRIALCHSFLGNVDSAKQSLDDASEVNPTAENLELVSRSIGKLKSSKREAIDASWTMAMGNAQRYGITKGVDSRMLSGDLESVWQFYFAPEKKYLRSADIVGHTLAGTAAHSASVEDTKTEVERGLIDAWREKSWRPVGELLINDGKAFFKTGADLSVWDVETAKGLPENKADDQKSSPTAKPALFWRSVWANAFMVDEATEMYRAFRKSYGVLNRRGGLSRNEVDSPRPNSNVEIQLFGDAIYHQMSILD
ncbi:MAG: tetratricopeptide repeat protein, partial [Planctomycetota bacterium]